MHLVVPVILSNCGMEHVVPVNLQWRKNCTKEGKCIDFRKKGENEVGVVLSESHLQKLCNNDWFQVSLTQKKTMACRHLTFQHCKRSKYKEGPCLLDTGKEEMSAKWQRINRNQPAMRKRVCKIWLVSGKKLYFLLYNTLFCYNATFTLKNIKTLIELAITL